MFKKNRHANMTDAEIDENIKLGHRFAGERRRAGDHKKAEEFEKGIKEDQDYKKFRANLKSVKNLRRN